jgi:large repetitive protein
MVGVWAMATAALAATTTLDTLLDTDNNTATGCAVTTSSGVVNGVERILRTVIVADGAGYRTQSTSVLTCSGAAFGAPVVTESTPRPIARGNGVGGATAVETSISALDLPRGGQMRVAFSAIGSDGLTGSDAVLDLNGAPILAALPGIVQVPTLGGIALVLLAGFMVGAVVLARRRGFHGVQLVVVAMFAAALSGHLIAAIVRDGLIADWTGIAPVANDAQGDAPAGTDIVAVFTQTDTNGVDFRVDMVLNATPSANPQSVTAKVGETLPITLTGSDFESSPLTFAIVTPPTQGTLGGSGANVTYTPNANATASDTFTFRVNDGQLDSTPATVTITNTRAPAITSANAVTFTPTQANSFTVLANGMPTPTTAVSNCSPALPATITFTADTNGGGTFSGNPTAAEAGAYVCTLTASNGITPNATQSFTLTVGGAPTITSAATLPDAIEGQNYSLHTLTATALSNTAPFQITALAQTGTAPSGLSLAAPTGLNTNAASALFNGTPAVCSRGAYAFNFTATNSFGTTTQAAALNVLGRNIAPSFASGGNQTVNEDAGAQSVDWATGTVSPGPSCESTQTLTFNVTNTNNALFSVQPAISPTGVLTYTPAANASGSATVNVSLQDNGGTTNGGADTSATVNFTITVNDVNDAPSFTKGADVTVLEDSSAFSQPGWATLISAGPANESAQTLTFNVTNSNNALFSVPPAIAANGTLTFTPAANASGTATVSVTLEDNGGTANGGIDTSAVQTFTITVQSPPTITSASTAVFPLDVDTTFTITTSAFPNVGSITLTANPGPDACALPAGITFNYAGGTTATLSGTATSATSATAVDCLVTASNGVPPAATQVLSIIPGTPPELLDDNFILLRGSASPAGPSPSPWNVFADNGNGADDLGIPTGVVTTFGDGSLGGTSASNPAGGTPITIPSSGGITVTIFTNGNLFVDATAGTVVNGTYAFDYVVQNAADTDVATVTIIVGEVPTISGVPPTSATIGSAYGPFNFTLGGSPTPTVSLVSGSCTLPTGITLSSAGTLSGTPSIGASSASGCIARVTNVFGTADSAPFAITVTVPPPVVTASGGATTFTEDGGAVTVDPSVTVTSAGTTNLTSATVTISANFQSGQDVLLCPQGGTLTCIVVGNVLTLTDSAPVSTYQTELRSVRFNNLSQAPTAVARTLSFAATNSAGTSTSTAASNKTVNVVAVNDAPSFTKGVDQTVLEDAGLRTVPGWATAISDGDGGGQTLTFNITGNTNPGLFSAGPAVSSTGTLTFTPAANANGRATIEITLSDDGSNTPPNVNTSAPQQFTITVTAVNDPPVAQNKNGGDVQANMRRVGIDASLLTGVTDADSGVDGCTPTFAVASITNGTNGTVSSVNLTNGTFDFEPTAGFTGTATVNYTVSDNGCPGSATSAAATISLNVIGPVIWFVNPTLAAPGNGSLSTPFNTLAAANTAKSTNTNNRIFLFNGGTNPVGTGVSLAGGTTQAQAQWLIGQGATATDFDTLMGITPPSGTIVRPAINGTRPTIQGTLTLDGNNVRAQGFNLSTGSATGMTDSPGAVTGVSVSEVSVTTTTGTAVNLSNLNGTISLTSVSSNGATNGIVLNNVNITSGSFAVTGTGSANSGGTIQNSTGTGVSLSDTRNTSFSWMSVTGSDISGFGGNNVTNWTLANSAVSNSGTVGGGTQGNIRFDNLLGTCAITDSTISGSIADGIRLTPSSGTLTMLTISGSTIGPNPAGNGMAVVSSGTAVTNVTITGGTVIRNNFAAGYLTTIGDTGTHTVSVSGSTFQDNNVGFDLGNGQNSIVTGVVDGNTFLRHAGSAMNLVSDALSTPTAKYTATVNNNMIGNGTPDSGSQNSFGIAVDMRGDVDAIISITNNTIRNTDIEGIFAQSRLDNTASAGNPVLDLTVRDNSVTDIDDNSALPFLSVNAVRIDSRNASTLCLDIAGNNAVGVGGAEHFRVRQRGTGGSDAAPISTFRAERLALGAQTAAAMATFVAGQNNPGSTASATAATNFTGVANGTCRKP